MTRPSSSRRLTRLWIAGMLLAITGLSVFQVDANASRTASSTPPATPNPPASPPVSQSDHPALHPNYWAQPGQLPASILVQIVSGSEIYPNTTLTPEPTTQTALRPPLVEVPFSLGPYDHFFFLRPFTADQVSWPEPDYRYGGIFFDNQIVHSGIDIDVPLGTPVLATAAGKIIWAGYGLFNGAPDPDDPYGLAVAIRHDFSFRDKTLYTIYAHLKRVDVVAGQVVASGEQLGLVGDTGNTTGPHLHFEIRLGQNTFFDTRNPELWLAPPEGWGVIAGRVMDTNSQLIRSTQVIVRPVGNDDLSWVVDTYGRHAVNSDDYYQENMVLSDLPAGEYEIMVEYLYQRYRLTVKVNPGQITYFTFTGKKGFGAALPALPGAETLPSPQP